MEGRRRGSGRRRLRSGASRLSVAATPPLLVVAAFSPLLLQLQCHTLDVLSDSELLG